MCETNGLQVFRAHHDWLGGSALRSFKVGLYCSFIVWQAARQWPNFGQIISQRLHLRRSDAPRLFHGAVPPAELPAGIITVEPIEYQLPPPTEFFQPALPAGIVVVPPINYPH